MFCITIFMSFVVLRFFIKKIKVIFHFAAEDESYSHLRDLWVCQSRIHRYHDFGDECLDAQKELHSDRCSIPGFRRGFRCLLHDCLHRCASHPGFFN